MISQSEYRARGLEPVEYDRSRALRVVDERSMSAEEREAFGENSELPPHIAALIGVNRQALPEGASQQRFEINKSYSHVGEIARLAKVLQPRIAPTVEADDMPSSETDKEGLLARLAGTEADLPSVSRKALEHELTPDAHYWYFTQAAMRPMFSKAITRARSSNDTEARSEGVFALAAARDFFSDRTLEVGPRGAKNAQSVLQGALEAPGAHWSKEEREALMSHFVAHSRMGNRSERQFETLRSSLPPEAKKAADWVVERGDQVGVMWQIGVMQKWPKGRFLETAEDLQSAAASNMQEAARDIWNPGASPSHASACKKMAIDLSRLPESDPNVLRKHSALNRAMLKTFPDPGLDEGARLLAVEVAGGRIAERERSLSQVITKGSDKGR